MGQGQNSCWSRSKVDLEGQRSGSPSQKCDFRSHLTTLHVMFYFKGQGQRSRRSGSKVTWVTPSLKVTVLAGGLTSTSSCIFLDLCVSVCQFPLLTGRRLTSRYFQFNRSQQVLSEIWLIIKRVHSF